MAVLDDRVERAFNRLREELSLFRVANDRLDRRLAVAMKPARTLFGIRAPQRIRFARNVIAWFARWRYPRSRESRAAARRVDD